MKLAGVSLKLQDSEIAQLKKKVEILLRMFEEKSLKNDSHNSHNPPSQDKGRAKLNQSRRRKSTKKSGGQSGHKGHTFQIRKNPTEVILLQNDYVQSVEKI